jgi:hypothetical protein
MKTKMLKILLPRLVPHPRVHRTYRSGRHADVFAGLHEQMTARAAKLRAIVAARQFSK